MPLPLPSLDNRRWSDLVAEGRALIPRHAPAWTDHNVHDPGIMLVELFAWLSEQLMYRANRIPERHLRKFLALAGFVPERPRPATLVLGAALPLGGMPLVLPAGMLFQSGSGDTLTTFRLMVPTPVQPTSLLTVQGYDGTAFADHSRAFRDGVAFAPLGVDPRPPVPQASDGAPALYLGFDGAIPAGAALHLFVGLDGTGWDMRERLLSEASARAATCQRDDRCRPCEPRGAPCDDEGAEGTASRPVPRSAAWTTVTSHHAVRTVWEAWTAAGWERLDTTGSVVDPTRGLTLDGLVVLAPGSVTLPKSLGTVAAPRHYLRCRVTAGRFDATPWITSLVPNAVLAGQRAPAWQRFTVVPTAVVTGVPVPGTRQALTLAFDARSQVTALTVEPAGSDVPGVRVLEWAAPAAPNAGTLTLEMQRIDVGLGFPGQVVEVPVAPLAPDSLSIRSVEPDGTGLRTRGWMAREDLDAARPTDAWVAVSHRSGTLTFGTGVRARLVPEGAPITVVSEATRGAAGNVAASRTWVVPDEPVTRAICGPDYATIASIGLTNRVPAQRGRDEEDVGDALERASAFFWAHERLVDLADGARTDTLDQVDPDRVLALVAPERATTTLDYERIARDVPGTRVARARAFASLDPRIPCYVAPGTVTVVVVPYLPADRPEPGAGLLAAVRRHLETRRVVTTRLMVTGPSYVDVAVQARVRCLTSADPARVRLDIIAALDDFLHPLHGGPDGLGWPFGRDVYRSEVLATIDAVEGVDHVLSASLSVERDGVAEEARCGNVCVPSTCLVSPLPHDIEVVLT